MDTGSEAADAVNPEIIIHQKLAKFYVNIVDYSKSQGRTCSAIPLSASGNPTFILPTPRAEGEGEFPHAFNGIRILSPTFYLQHC